MAKLSSSLTEMNPTGDAVEDARRLARFVFYYDFLIYTLDTNVVLQSQTRTGSTRTKC